MAGPTRSEITRQLLLEPAARDGYFKSAAFKETRIKPMHYLLWSLCIDVRFPLNLDYLYRSYLNHRQTFGRVQGGNLFLSSAYDIAAERHDSSVLFCSMPKSASTFISKLTVNAMGRAHVFELEPPSGFNTSFEYRQLALAIQQGYTIHSHVKATTMLVCFLLELGVKPIITYLNIYDAVESAVFRNANNVELQKYGLKPKAQLDQGRLDTMIDLFLADYILFFASWVTTGRVCEPLYLSFDQITNDPIDSASRIKEHLGAPIDLEVAKEFVDENLRGTSEQKAQINISQNRPRIGLSQDSGLIERTHRIFDQFEGVDFRPIDPTYHRKKSS